MKRQFILAMMLMVIGGGMIKAQSVDDVFIIGTSIRLDDDSDVTGFIRFGPNSKPIYETPRNSFFIFSVEKDYFIFFRHINYKESERLKIVPKRRRWDYMKTVTIPKNDLSKFNLTDVDEFLQEKSKYEAWQWAKDVKGSKKGIWVIDRNDDFVKNGIEYVILYEVYLVETNEPVFEEEEDVS